MNMGASAEADRAGRASTEPSSAGSLGHSATIPSALSASESIDDHIARIIALHGLGTVSGAARFNPPTAEWGRTEWQRRILSVIPTVAEMQCRDAARAIVKAILGRSNEREIDDGIRTAPRHAAEQVRRHNPGMHGLALNLERLSDVLDKIAVCEVLDASRIEARSDETAKQAQPEGQEPGGEAETPKGAA
jgi:hypothetical protein